MPLGKMVAGAVLPASAVAIGLSVMAAATIAPLPGFGTVASAQEGGQRSQGDSDGGRGQGGQGSQSGQDNQGSNAQGQGGPGPDSEGQGPQGGVPPEETGGRPPWAKEGIPEVELGRLSVARSPDQVLDRAYAEALAQIADMADFYNLSLDEMETELSDNWDNLTIIDSPLQNLAIFRDALDGSIDLSAYGISNDPFTIMAVTLGVASDKTLEITPETAYAISVIFADPMTEAEATALATAAEDIREAVYEGHEG